VSNLPRVINDSEVSFTGMARVERQNGLVLAHHADAKRGE